MLNQEVEYHYKQIEDSISRSLDHLKIYKEVNSFLKQNGWLFISPIFFQGGELQYFLDLKNKNENAKDKINQLIFHKFYNLNWTASFIEGYCKRCTYIEPFLQSIEHSLILTFQRDYEGGIKTLIPIIEGTLRNYINSEKQHLIEKDKISFWQLKKSIDLLKDDLIANYKQILLNYKDQNNRPINFSDSQIEHLLEVNSNYYQIWISFLKDFIDNSFYLDSSKREDNHEGLMRHVIDHGLDSNFKYNLENYIKVYFVLQFLTWIFLIKENKSVLNEISAFRHSEKAIAYKNIIEASNKLFYQKHLLMKEYSNYNIDLFKEPFKVSIEKSFKGKNLIKYKIFRLIDKFLWKKNLIK